MNKILYVFFFCWLTAISLFGQSPTNAIQGKTFVREVSSVCKMFKDRGCLITTYHYLTFEDNRVLLTSEEVSDCDQYSPQTSNPDKELLNTYTYQIHKKRNSTSYIVRINGYNGFELLSDKLIELAPIDKPDYPEENKITFELKK